MGPPPSMARTKPRTEPRAEPRVEPPASSAVTIGGRGEALKCPFPPSRPVRMEGTHMTPPRQDLAPPTPPIPLASLLALPDLGLRQVAGPSAAGSDVRVLWVHTSEMEDP